MDILEAPDTFACCVNFFRNISRMSCTATLRKDGVQLFYYALAMTSEKHTQRAHKVVPACQPNWMMCSRALERM